MLTSILYDLEEEEARKIARAFIEIRGGLSLIKRLHSSQKDKLVPHLYIIACCFLCLSPVWVCTSKSDVDKWDIDDSNHPFGVCSTCGFHLSSLNFDRRLLTENIAAAQVVVFGRTLLRLHDISFPDTALDILRAGIRKPL